MGKGSNIVHQYFKKEFEEYSLLVKVNPITYLGSEITVHKNGELQIREMEFGAQIVEDLTIDGFMAASPLEFNLYLSGLA